MNDEFLCFVRCLSQPDSEGNYLYELFFSSNPDEVYGTDFGEAPAAVCSDLKPCDEAFDFTRKVKIPFELICIADSTQFSVQDAMDHCVCLSYESLFDKEYPAEGRLVLQFGEPFDDVEMKLATRGLTMEK